MGSVILSFIGNQDPVSDQTSEEGSLVTLVHHLKQQECNIRRVILLHTLTTADRAELTKAWLGDTPLHVPEEIIELIPVDEKLSKDPISLLLAVQEARRGIEIARQYLTKQDRLEFNASSGTPVMKSAWSILQAAGYAPQSSVWQVRNPKEMRPEQPRVFQTNVDRLKKEFDLKVVERQINDYNYSGALATLKTTELGNELVTALLEYGHYRICFDFDKAFSRINKFSNTVEVQLIRDISGLRQKNQELLLKEIYFKARIKLKNQEYSDFLVLLFSFQESLLRFLMLRKFSSDNNQRWRDVEQNIWQAIKKADGVRLYQYLQRYRLDNGRSLRLDQENIHRFTMIAIIEYYPEFSSLIAPVKYLEVYCKQRNDSVHQCEGVSEIQCQNEIISNLDNIFQQITNISKTNPFDVLNKQICSLLFANIPNVGGTENFCR